MTLGDYHDDWEQALDDYYEAFGQGFPASMHGGTIEEMQEAIDDCIARNEPYDGGVSASPGNGCFPPHAAS